MAPLDGDEIIELVSDEPPTTTWWDRYERSLRRTGMTDTSVSVIRADSAYIVDRGILGSDESAASSAGGPTRTGLVMGAVQSGKTASMMGVAALSLDAGFDLIVILAGTRVALWRQTYQRAVTQLFDDEAPAHRLLPEPATVLEDDADIRIDRLYALNRHRARRLIRDRHPLVMVVMKNVHHIRAAAAMLHESVYAHLEGLGRDLRILVLDDEADDGSILDALVERGLDPNADALKQVPRHIARLWGQHGDGRTTVDPRLQASYVAYTATPQANLLQADQNPLAPRDFVAALRTPGPVGSLERREPTYRDPAGLSRWYTGGEIFHRALGRTALIISEPEPRASGADDHTTQLAELQRALRAYLVAGSIRLWRTGDRYHAGEVYESSAAARDASPEPHSMLFHPSARVADHFAAAALVLELGHGLTREDALRAVHAGVRHISNGALEADLRTHEAEWRRWLQSYRETATLVRDHFGLADSEIGAVPDDAAWDEITDLLVNQVIPHTKLAIVNSDPAADDRPRFDPIQTDDGWHPAPDLATVFVSGNVMARGLTLEGLTTTLFLRSSGDPVADTQQQMQRWFGYRGGYIELCRIFVPRGQHELFEQYHESDEALRRQIISAMGSSEEAPKPSVLEGERYRATGKLRGLTKIPLCPGSAPLVRLIHEDGGTEETRSVVADVVRRPHSPVVVSGTFRGHLLEEPLTLIETAHLLEGLRYHDYVPDPEDSLVERWRSVEAQLDLEGDDASPLFRGPMPTTSAPPSPVRPSSCPYTIAAYLRLWDACLTRHARGLFPTEDGTTPWSALDLQERRRAQPRFWVGIRSGSGAALTGEGFDDLEPRINLMQRSIEDGQLVAGWGGRSDVTGPDAYLGDARFDHHLHPSAPDPISFGGTAWRPPGSDGLILFMPVATPGREPVFAVGVVIPLGGPDQIAASRATDL